MDGSGSRRLVMALAATAAIAIAALVLSVLAVTQEDAESVHVYRGDAYSANVGSRDDGGFTAAEVEAGWDASDAVTISGQFQASSAHAEGTVVGSILIDGVSVASSSSSLGKEGMVTVPLQAAPTSLETGDHDIEIVAVFIGDRQEEVAIEGGQLVVTVFPKE
jgi:hypothetical protein